MSGSMLFLLTRAALAWGPEAHEEIASRAEARLSPEARSALAIFNRFALPGL